MADVDFGALRALKWPRRGFYQNGLVTFGLKGSFGKILLRQNLTAPLWPIFQILRSPVSFKLNLGLKSRTWLTRKKNFAFKVPTSLSFHIIIFFVLLQLIHLQLTVKIWFIENFDLPRQVGGGDCQNGLKWQICGTFIDLLLSILLQKMT